MKWFFKIIFFGSLCLNFYLISKKQTIVETSNLEEDNILHSTDKVKTAQASVKKNIKNTSKKTDLEKKNQELDITEEPNLALTEEEKIEEIKKDYEAEYKKAQKSWQNKASLFLEEGLGYSHQYAEDYFYLQTERNKAISEYMAPFMESENEDDPYYFTIEDNIAVSKINELYLNKLREKLGEEAYRRFMDYKNNYNKEMIKEGKGSYYIEF